VEHEHPGEAAEQEAVVSTHTRDHPRVEHEHPGEAAEQEAVVSTHTRDRSRVELAMTYVVKTWRMTFPFQPKPGIAPGLN